MDSKQNLQTQQQSGISELKHELSVKTCPVVNVTVFIDRAEVNRFIKLNLSKGNVEVLIKDIPASADKDSVR